jgi:hypothetical protein
MAERKFVLRGVNDELWTDTARQHHKAVAAVAEEEQAALRFASLVPFQGPKKSQFSGPTPSIAPRNNVAPLKIITYRAIKTTGTLVVISLAVY